MTTREQVEMLAKRYGVGISYTTPGNGGFIVDSTNKVYSSMKKDLLMSFKIESCELKNKDEYSISNKISLLAA
ncbi:hypothetical protein [Lacrimispora sp.]|uniref:hypothetical protein n=1 Tax=Lacrimispora sp. TaxID=2719234 RepID=UPI0028AEB0BF|nr:hypothetical protein [Lacrimispora sp.]